MAGAWGPSVEGRPIYKGVRKGGFGVKKTLELDILQKRYYLRERD